MKRDYNYDILPEIKNRYATKNFKNEKITREELMPIFEAARYAPSCYNEQPWRFIVGNDDEIYEKLSQTIGKGNEWARRTPVLILITTTKYFKLNAKENEYSRFDTGTASGFLQLEAVHRGFGVHCFAGFDATLARELLHIPDDWDIIAMLALGKQIDVDDLPPERKAEEEPGTRNPLGSILWNEY